MSNYIPNQFPKWGDSKIALIGEASGAEEDAAIPPMPFVGYAGSELNDLLNKSNIMRSSCYVGNIARYRPPGNVFEKLPNEVIRDGLAELKRDLEVYKPNVIVPLGNIPLNFLTNKIGISKWRGSIIESTLVKGVKCIPTFHPAAILRNYEWKHVSLLDFKRIAEDAKFPELNLPNRTLVTRPTLDDVLTYIKFLQTVEEFALDIETVKDTGIVLCLSLSHSPEYSMCIPLIEKNYRYWTVEDEILIWRALGGLFSNEAVGKILQNAGFDAYILAKYHRAYLRNISFDTLVAHHVLNAELPHGLDFLSSIYTREPYYKDDRESWSKRELGAWDTLFSYNCKDSAVTIEVKHCLVEELNKEGLTHIFDQEMKEVTQAILMSLYGVRIDDEIRKSGIANLTRRTDRLNFILKEVLGNDLNPNSHKQLKELLYTDLKYKVRVKDGKVTTDENALLDLYSKYEDQVLPLIIFSKKSVKAKSFYKYKLDEDNRFRATHKPFGTVSGRWSTSQTADDLGSNLQNIPHLARRQFIADDGMVFVEVDGEQVEARIVAYLANCRGQIEIFESGSDLHSINAMRMFNITADQVDYSEHGNRYLAKKTVHASNYLMRGKRLAQEMLKDADLLISEVEAQALIDAYFKLYPEIIYNYHNVIKLEVHKTRRLYNCFGRVLHFWGRFSDSLYREAYAFKPQSTCGDWINKSMLHIAERLPDIIFYVHTHDGLLLGVQEDAIDQWMPTIVDCFRVPIPIHEIDRYIPIKVKTGKRWGELKSIDISSYS